MSAHSSSHQTYVIELNEFNLALLQRATQACALPFLTKILSWQHARTTAYDQIEHQGLDPWVQWVSVHTERPSSEHKVIRLGDVHKLQGTQIWQRLSLKGISSGVWGVMNAVRGDAPHNQFFLPDPWNHLETGHPALLDDFLALPRYYSKNYLDYSWRDMARLGFKAAQRYFSLVPFKTFAADAFFLLRQLVQGGMGSYFVFAAFELASARLFAVLRNRYAPDVNIIFLNSIAHFQHHEWQATDSAAPAENTSPYSAPLSKRARALFLTVERTLSVVLEHAKPDDGVVVLNALSQQHVSEGDLYCWRQHNPARFLKKLGIVFERVEQCMTNDGHVYFANARQRDQALAILKSARVVQNAPSPLVHLPMCAAIYAEADSLLSSKLFYQFSYWGEGDAHTRLIFDARLMTNKPVDTSTEFSIPLLDEFDIHAKRTGEHVPEGDVFYSGCTLPAQFENYRLFEILFPH